MKDVEEPTYAEIVDIHPPPSSEVTLITNVSTTLPPSTTTTLPSTLETPLPPPAPLEANTLPLSRDTEKDKLLDHHRRSGVRVSMSETSLTDEIMMALRDKLNDPSLYCTVLDAKGGGAGGTVKEEDFYCAPIYSDPNQIT